MQGSCTHCLPLRTELQRLQERSRDATKPRERFPQRNESESKTFGLGVFSRDAGEGFGESKDEEMKGN